MLNSLRGQAKLVLRSRSCFTGPALCENLSTSAPHRWSGTASSYTYKRKRGLGVGTRGLPAVRLRMDRAGPASDPSPHTGTTIVAVAYDGGVVIGADSRVSTGNYVSNRASDKMTALSDTAWLLRSGSAADTQAVSDYVHYFAQQHAIELDRSPDVQTIANLVMKMNYNNKAMLLGALIIAGWDAHEGGQVYGCPIGGTLVRENWTTDGSGSTYIWGYLDSAYREGMTRAETEECVATALSLAMSRDGSSGGLARLVTISKEGTFRQTLRPDQLPLYWDELAPGGAPVGMVV